MSGERQKHFELFIEERPDLLFIRAKGGTPSLDDMRELLGNMMRLLKTSGQRKVLVEMDVEEPLSVADNFWFVSDFEDAGMQRYQLAVVDKNADHLDVLKFAEAVAANRGISARAFLTLDEAESWLAEA